MIINLIILIIALGLAIYLRQLIQSFGFMSLSELRRRSDAGNLLAQKVLASRIYGLKLWFILWFIFGALIITVVLSLDRLLPTLTYLAALIATIVFILLLFILPRIKFLNPKLHTAAKVSLYLAKFLNKIQGLAKIFSPLKLSQKINIDPAVAIHSKEHLIETLQDLRDKTNKQKVLADLDLAILTLTFSSKKIKSLMTPVEKMKTLKSAQNLTPKLIDELHNSGFSIFPVLRSAKDDFCGVLHLEDVEKLNRVNLTVYQAMRPEIYYIPAKAPLNQILNAFLKTGQQLFLVINQSRQILGLITLRDVLQQFMNGYQADDFKYYDEPELVAGLFTSTKTESSKIIPPSATKKKKQPFKKARQHSRSLKKKIKNKTTKRKK